MSDEASATAATEERGRGPELAVLSAPGVSLVLDVAGPSLPRVLHWGEELDPAGEAGDAALLPQGAVPNNGVDDSSVSRCWPARRTAGWAPRGWPGTAPAGPSSRRGP